MPEWHNFKKLGLDDEGEEWKNNRKEDRAKNLYNQGRVVFKCATIFCETLRGEMAEMTKELILQNAMLLCPKILGAEGGDSYVLRMENASIIRTNAKELETQVRASFLFENCAEADKNIVLIEINKFKILFKEWVRYFEKDEFEDDWGLY